ncbi:MAG: hypothetical protein FWJ70_17010 [Micromonosporaceae bacterium]|jgi:hypothetical protein
MGAGGVVALAALGVLLLRERGLATAGVDPYLSTVPVLLAVAAGIVALRLYVWPMRILAMVVRRRRGVTASELWPPAADPAGAADEVAAVPGVEVVAAVGSSGRLVSGDAMVQNVNVISVDAPTYQRILESVGSPVRLPRDVTSAGPTTDPLPILAPPNLADREQLVVRVGDEQPSVVPVGDVAGLPGLERRGTWVLVPRQALAPPGPVDELMMSGPDADPEDVRATVGSVVDGGGDLTVTTLTQVRDRIGRTGFNKRTHAPPPDRSRRRGSSCRSRRVCHARRPGT